MRSWWKRATIVIWLGSETLESKTSGTAAERREQKRREAVAGRERREKKERQAIRQLEVEVYSGSGRPIIADEARA